jgi:hypothetical protein
MFEGLFDFSLQRTPLQALGFYLFYFAIAVLIGGLTTFAALSLGYISIPTGDFAAGFQAGAKIGRWIAPIVPIVVAGMVASTRPLGPAIFLLTLLALFLALVTGWFAAGIPIAILTTRPPRAAAKFDR